MGPVPGHGSVLGFQLMHQFLACMLLGTSTGRNKVDEEREDIKREDKGYRPLYHGSRIMLFGGHQ